MSWFTAALPCLYWGVLDLERLQGSSEACSLLHLRARLIGLRPFGKLICCLELPMATSFNSYETCSDITLGATMYRCRVAQSGWNHILLKAVFQCWSTKQTRSQGWKLFFLLYFLSVALAIGIDHLMRTAPKRKSARWSQSSASSKPQLHRVPQLTSVPEPKQCQEPLQLGFCTSPEVCSWTEHYYWVLVLPEWEQR